jgi:hypothetical protein
MRAFACLVPIRRAMPGLLLALAAVLVVPAAAHAQPGGHAHGSHGAAPQPTKAKSHHPRPRRGVTGERVLRPDSVPERAREPYTMAARIPSVFDGLYCHCDCHEREGLRSLLECFEEEMATTCGICQSQARMAAELHAQGKSLDEIRRAIDQRFGG